MFDLFLALSPVILSCVLWVSWVIYEAVKNGNYSLQWTKHTNKSIPKPTEILIDLVKLNILKGDWETNVVLDDTYGTLSSESDKKWVDKEKNFVVRFGFSSYRDSSSYVNIHTLKVGDLDVSLTMEERETLVAAIKDSFKLFHQKKANESEYARQTSALDAIEKMLEIKQLEKKVDEQYKLVNEYKTSSTSWYMPLKVDTNLYNDKTD